MEKSKIFYSLSEIRDIEPVSAALGFFDGLHLGHAEVINSAVKNGSGLKLSDKSRQFEHNAFRKSAVFTFNNRGDLPKMAGARHILSNELKLSLIAQMGVDYIITLDFNEIRDYSPERFVREVLKGKINAKIVSCGDSFKFGKDGACGVSSLKDLCRTHEIAVNVVPQVTLDGKPVSSTYIRRLIADGDIAAANRFLGYELFYEAEVIKGAMLGRTLGTPTINQIIPNGNVLPKFGVYKTCTEIMGVKYKSITNIGIKPTLSSNAAPLMETYVPDFDGDLYGETIRVFLCGFIREERKFKDINALKTQIAKDIRDNV